MEIFHLPFFFFSFLLFLHLLGTLAALLLPPVLILLFHVEASRSVISDGVCGRSVFCFSCFFLSPLKSQKRKTDGLIVKLSLCTGKKIHGRQDVKCLYCLFFIISFPLITYLWVVGFFFFFPLFFTIPELAIGGGMPVPV